MLKTNNANKNRTFEEIQELKIKNEKACNMAREVTLKFVVKLSRYRLSCLPYINNSTSAN